MATVSIPSFYQCGVFGNVNQSINFYSTNIPGVARLSGATTEPVFKTQNLGSSSTTSRGHLWCWCLRGGGGGAGQVKEMCLETFSEWSSWGFSGRTNSRRFCQRERAKEWTDLLPALVLTLGTDSGIYLLYVSKWDGSDEASIEWR